MALKYLIDHGLPEDAVINMTPLKGSTNQSLRSDPPSAVVSSEKVDKSAFRSHLIEYESLKKDEKGFDEVLEYRMKHALDLVASKTGVKAIAE